MFRVTRRFHLLFAPEGLCAVPRPGDSGRNFVGGGSHPMTSTQPASLTRRELREREQTQRSLLRRGSRGRSKSRPPRRSDKVRVARVVSSKAPASRCVRQRVASRFLSFGALFFAGAMLVGLSVPASAFFVSHPTAVTAAEAPVQQQGQTLSAEKITAGATPIQRDGWGVTEPVPVPQLASGFQDSSYTVNNAGAVHWPFAFAVKITDGFGSRVSPCSGCSSSHRGTDFTPGIGAPIGAIADGVVSLKKVDAWGLGNHVFIDHVINGEKVTSVYAHMLSGSSPLEVGSTVKAGDLVGLVGSTGASTGPHLHFEIRLNGTDPINAVVWLNAHATGT